MPGRCAVLGGVVACAGGGAPRRVFVPGVPQPGPGGYVPAGDMIAAFFHDERFTRDEAGTYRGTGAVPYPALARYLRHFDRVVVVGRLEAPNAWARTVVSGPGLEFACIPRAALTPGRALPVAVRHVREVLSRVDAAVVRMPSMIGPVACREAIRLHRPYLVEVVADAFEAMWHHGSWKGRIAALPLALVERHHIARAPYAIYVTREALQRRYPPGGASIAVSDVEIDPPQQQVLMQRLARIARRTPGAPAAVGLIGSYDVRYKGHETALRAVALLRRQGRDVRLRCLGAGDPGRWRARAAALGVASAVELHHALPHGGPVLGWMDALDLYAAPSLVEGLSRALVEAMSRALPAVGSRRGGNPELLDARYLHAAGDAGGLAALLARLLDDPAELERQARRSFVIAGAYARDGLDARRDAFVRAFREAIAGGARSASASA